MKHLRTYFILTIIAFVITSCTDGEQMRQRLADVQACNQADTVFSSRWLPTADSLVDYFDSHGTPNERLMAHYLQGRVYHDMGEAPQAIDCYQQAVEQVDTAAEDCDFRTLGCVYSQMADVFHGQLLFTNAIQARKQATYYAFMSNDNINGLYDRRIMAGEYILLQKKDSAEVILRDVIKLYHEKGKVQDALQASLIQMYLLCDKPEHANDLKQLIDNYDCNSQYFDERHELPPLRRMFYYYKGKYYEAVNQLDTAELYYRKMFHENMPIPMKNSMTKGLLGIYQRRNIPDSIAKYAQLYCEANDSSIAIKDQELTGRLAASYHYTRQQRIAEAKSLEASRNRQYLAISLFLGVFISILACFYIFWQRHRKKTEMRHIELEFQHQINMLEQAKYDLEKLKQKEYDALLTQKQEEINEWQQEVEKMRQQTNPQYILDSKIVETDIYQRLQFVVAHPAEKMKKTDWTRLNEMINELLPHFVHRINALYHVSEEDYRICMLIRLNFSLSEICILTGLTPKLLYKRRKFMSKKFFSSDEKPELFDKRIKNIS